MKSNSLVVCCVALLCLQYVRSEITPDNADPAGFCKETCGDVKCEGDPLNKNAIVCKCKEEYEDFNEKDKTCEVNYCKKVCGLDPKIKCDDPYKEKELKDCGCHESFMYYRPSKKSCHRQCHELFSGIRCENEGQCVKEGKDKFCDCPEGTTGDYCQTITECSKSLKRCTFGSGRCVFKNGKAECECILGTKFYEKGGYCEDRCTKDDDCATYDWIEPSKFCNEDGFCECPEGHENYNCWNVPGCNELYYTCKEQNAECVYDKYAKNKATCKCNEKGFTYDPKAKQCKADFCEETCGDVKCEGDPLNKTAIVCKCEEEYEDFNPKHKTCEVNICKEVCGTDPEIDCDESDTKMELEDCSCDTPKFFRPSKKRCQEQCSNISSWTEVHCRNGGKCVSEGDEEFCECPEGTTGDFCENITECDTRFKGCKGDRGKCVFQDGKARCECSKDNTVFNKRRGYCEGK